MSSQNSNSALAPAPKSDKKKESNDSDKSKLDARERNLAIADLRYQTAYYREAAQAILDGVTLGAENVQDKRIDILEQGPLTTTEDFIWTIALTLILEGTIGPAIAAWSARIVLKPLARATARAIGWMQDSKTKALFYNFRLYRSMAADLQQQSALVKGTQSSELAQMAKELLRTAELLAPDVKKEITRRKDVTKSIRASLNKIGRFVENNLVAAAKVPGAVDGQKLYGEDLSKNVSAGAEILGAAMASASRLRLTIEATHEALEAQLGDEDTTRAQAREILDNYRIDGEVDLASIRSSHALATEAMIWARILLDADAIDRIKAREKRAQDYLRQREQIRNQGYWSDPVAGVRPGADHVRLEPLSTVVLADNFTLAADKRLVSYLLARFGQDVERWADENKKIVFTDKAWNSPAGFRTPRDNNWWSKTEKENQQDLLVQYLANVADSLSPDELKLR